MSLASATYFKLSARCLFWSISSLVCDFIRWFPIPSLPPRRFAAESARQYLHPTSESAMAGVRSRLAETVPLLAH